MVGGGNLESRPLDEPIEDSGVVSESGTPENTRENEGCDHLGRTGPVEGKGQPGLSVRRERRDLDTQFATKTIKYTKRHTRGETEWTRCVRLD